MITPLNTELIMMLHFSLKALCTDNIWNIPYCKLVHNSLNVGKKKKKKQFKGITKKKFPKKQYSR